MATANDLDRSLPPLLKLGVMSGLVLLSGVLMATAQPEPSARGEGEHHRGGGILKGCEDAARIAAPAAKPFEGGRFVVSDAAPDFRAAGLHAFWTDLWQGEKPSSQLERQFLAAASTSALACPNVARDLAKRFSLSDKLPGDPSSVVSSQFRLKIGMPVVGVSGRDAVLLVQTQGPGLGGSIRLEHLKKEATSWAVKGVREITSS